MAATLVDDGDPLSDDRTSELVGRFADLLASDAVRHLDPDRGNLDLSARAVGKTSTTLPRAHTVHDLDDPETMALVEADSGRLEAPN